MAIYGNKWRNLAINGDKRQYMVIYGNKWRYMALYATSACLHNTASCCLLPFVEMYLEKIKSLHTYFQDAHKHYKSLKFIPVKKNYPSDKYERKMSLVDILPSQLKIS